MAHQASTRNNSKTKPNHLYSILSVAFVLFLLGLFGLTMIHANKLVTYFKENINIMVELKDEATDQDIEMFKSKLTRSKFVNEQTLQLITKEDAANIMKQELGDDLDLLGENPFFDTYNFSVFPVYMNPDSLAVVSSLLRSNEIVREVYYPEELSINISKIIGQLAIAMLLFSLIFILIAIFLINNTVKLALYSNRFIIKNMQLVGAPWAFIRKSYMRRSIINGCISAVLAIAALVGTVYLGRQKIAGLREIQDITSFCILFFLLFLLGIGISWISTRWGVNKYLKMRLDDLY